MWRRLPLLQMVWMAADSVSEPPPESNTLPVMKTGCSKSDWPILVFVFGIVEVVGLGLLVPPPPVPRLCAETVTAISKKKQREEPNSVFINSTPGGVYEGIIRLKPDVNAQILTYEVRGIGLASRNREQHTQFA